MIDQRPYPEKEAAIALMDFTFEALSKPPRESEEEHEDRTTKPDV
jgi:hypothetical protein